MRLPTRLVTRAATQLQYRTTTTVQTPRIKTKATMSAPGIPSAPLQSQSTNAAEAPGQTQGLSQKSAGSTATGPVVGAGAGGAAVGGSAVGGRAGGDDAASYEITSTDLNTAAGVELSARQRVLVGGVLDLFKGLPTKKKTSLWTDDATFADPLTKAQGRKQYEAQWWGLKAAFSEIEQQHHLITSSGNPITLDLKTRYKVKGLGTEKVIESVIMIHTDEQGQRVVGVEDKWNGNIPEGPIATAFRNLNSVVVPAFVGVPKDDAQK